MSAEPSWVVLGACISQGFRGTREENSVNNSGSPYHHSYRLTKLLGCSLCRNSYFEFLLLKVRSGYFQAWRLTSLL